MDGVRQSLEKYIRLEISASELRTVLGPSWSFERTARSYSFKRTAEVGEAVVVGVDHIRHAIDGALDARIPLGALQEWANFILLCDECDVGPYLDERTREHLTTVLHEIASPELFGRLTPQKLQEMKATLAVMR